MAKTGGKAKRPTTKASKPRGAKTGKSAGARRSRAAKAAAPKRNWRRLALRASALAVIWIGVAAVAVVGYLYLTLPSLDEATRLQRGPTAQLLDRDGAFIASFGELHGEMVSVEELPPHLPRAIIAIEDHRFYEHGGIDPIGVLRAMVVNVTSGRLRQGASTITQQLARNLLLGHARSFERKAREALLALELERRFSKDQILTIYMNRVYFGGGAYGVDAAARRFFGKPAREVDLWEAALLAGSLKAPSRLAPDRAPEAAAARAKLVLQAMAREAFIPKEAAERPIALAASAASALGAPKAGDARYFVDWAVEQAEGFMGGLASDVLVQTTLDLDLQRLAEHAVEAGLRGRPKAVAARNWPSQAALVAMTPNGAVLAMVGGRSYVASQFNRAVQARRQMGSVFKPFVYLAAMEAGFAPDDVIVDAPISVDGWRPRNFKNRYYGEVTLREALARSLNAPAVRLAERVGRRKAVVAARKLGLASPLPDGPSVSLGAGAATLLEVTGAYAALAAGGRFAPPYGVVEVRSRAGDVLYKPTIASSQVVSRVASARMNDMLAAAVAWGSGKGAQVDRQAAGKTGTSQKGRDAWFVGFTADLVVGVWVGHDDDRPIPGLTGGGLPARIWRSFVASTSGRYPARPLPMLENYVAAPPSRAPQTTAAKPERREWPRFAPRPSKNVTYDYPDGGE